MSHPHDDFLDPFVRALLKDRIQSRNQGLPAFQRKTLLTAWRCAESFQTLGLNDFSKDSQLFIVRKGGLVFIGLDTGLNPTPFFGRLNMKVLDPTFRNRFFSIVRKFPQPTFEPRQDNFR